MTDEAQNEAEELFQRILDQPVEQRGSYLDRECSGRPTLRRDVETLLRHYAEAEPGFLEPRADSPGAIGMGHPEHIGHYRILREIGRGGMGTVYEAQQAHPRRTVALKVLRPGLATPELLRRFEYEVQVLGRLKHPNIAQIIEGGVAGEGNEQPFFAMELIEGQRLEEFVAHADVSTHQRLELFTRICDAVHYAHQKGVIHRDLKPSNILVVEYGSTDSGSAPSHSGATDVRRVPQPKILDFGLAKLTDADVAVTTMVTEVGRIQGTLPYMSPEQARGRPDEIDSRTDVYSLGVILYELLTGCLPYDVQNTMLPEAVRVICEDPPRRPSTIGRHLRSDLETITLKALEKDPDRRYPSVSALADDIRRYLADQPILARRPSTVYQLRKLAARHKAVATSLVSLLVVLTAFGAWMGLLYRRSDRLRLAARQEAARARQTQAFLEKMLSSVDPEVAKGHDTALIRTILAEAADDVGVELAGQPEIEADIRTTIGAAYLSVGLAADAQEQLEGALAIRRRTLGEAHETVAASLRLLAECAGKLGDRERAETLAREALELRRANAKGADINVAEALQTLAWITSELAGKHAEAASLYHESLEITAAVAGREHPLYAEGLHRLAITLWRWGRHAEAEPIAREALTLKRALYGADHPSVARATDLLGQILTSEKDYAAAEPLIRESVSMHRRLYGENHPAFVSALNSLADLLASEGDYAAAEPLARQCVERIAELRGEQSHETAFAWMNLANLLDKKGDYAEAERLYHEADRRFRVVFPPDHPYVHSPLTRLAEMLDRIGQHEQAEPIWRQVVDETRQAFPPGHTYHMIAVDKAGGLGRCLLQLGRCAEAEGLLTSWYEELREHFNARNDRTIAAAGQLARFYEVCGPEEEAQPYREIVEAAGAETASERPEFATKE